MPRDFSGLGNVHLVPIIIYSKKRENSIKTNQKWVLHESGRKVILPQTRKERESKGILVDKHWVTTLK